MTKHKTGTREERLTAPLRTIATTPGPAPPVHLSVTPSCPK
jgi:hypothetical protein